MSDKILTSVARKRSFPKGCNWAPSCSDEVESNSCLEQMDNIMGNPSKSSIMLVPGLMEKHLLCEDHISTLVLLYPAFLTNTWHLS
jgi:hypothetical protein